jgi:hypothetical protein
MVSDGSDRSGLTTAGGILSIIGGALELTAAGIAAVSVTVLRALFGAALPYDPDTWFYRALTVAPVLSVVIGLPALALGAVAIVGGISAIRRKRLGLSLAGAICALPSGIPGILAVIFIAVSRKDFRARS